MYLIDVLLLIANDHCCYREVVIVLHIAAVTYPACAKPMTTLFACSINTSSLPAFLTRELLNTFNRPLWNRGPITKYL